MKRIIPNLLYNGNYAVKGKNYRKHKYVGDLLNTVKLFNELEVDELIISNIGTSVDFELLHKVASQAFMPVTYAGQITDTELAKKIINCGFEKVGLNSLYFNDIEETKKIIDTLGAQSVSLSLNIKKDIFGRRIVAYNSLRSKKRDFDAVLKELQNLEIGDLIFNSVSHEGLVNGVDVSLIDILNEYRFKGLALYSGGVNSKKDFDYIVNSTLDGAVCGRSFIFKGKHDAVLINKPKLI